MIAFHFACQPSQPNTKLAAENFKKRTQNLTFLFDSAWWVSIFWQRCTRFLTSDFIFEIYNRATVNSSSSLPFPSVANYTPPKINSIKPYLLGKVTGNKRTTFRSVSFPNVTPISAKSFSKWVNISVILRFWWTDISFSCWSSDVVAFSKLYKSQKKKGQSFGIKFPSQFRRDKPVWTIIPPW